MNADEREEEGKEMVEHPVVHLSISYSNRELLAKKFGVNEWHVLQAEEILKDLPRAENTKEELLTGYTKSQLNRSKCISRLGTTEEMIDEERSKALGRLGVGYDYSDSSIPVSSDVMSSRFMSCVNNGVDSLMKATGFTQLTRSKDTRRSPNIASQRMRIRHKIDDLPETDVPAETLLPASPTRTTIP